MTPPILLVVSFSVLLVSLAPNSAVFALLNASPIALNGFIMASFNAVILPPIIAKNPVTAVLIFPNCATILDDLKESFKFSTVVRIPRAIPLTGFIMASLNAVILPPILVKNPPMLVKNPVTAVLMLSNFFTNEFVLTTALPSTPNLNEFRNLVNLGNANFSENHADKDPFNLLNPSVIFFITFEPSALSIPSLITLPSEVIIFFIVFPKKLKVPFTTLPRSLMTPNHP